MSNYKSVKRITEENRPDEFLVVDNDDTTMSVPSDVNNRHYQMIQEWVAEGNTIEEGDD